DKGDYYYRVTEGGETTFYFFTNVTYNFGNTTFTEISETLATSPSAGMLEIGANTGTFTFKAGGTKYNAVVFPYVSQFGLGQALIMNKEQYLSQENIYQIGVGIDNFNYSEFDLKDNAFKFDLILKTTGGKNINILDLGKYAEDYLVYEFYEGSYSLEELVGKTSVTEEEIGKYSYETNSWVFNSNNVNNTYTVLIKINENYVPKALNDVIVPSVFTFKLNDNVNVYDHKQLKAMYENVNDTNIKGINIHNNIVAELAAWEVYTNDTSLIPENVRHLLAKSDTGGLVDGQFSDKIIGTSINFNYYTDRIAPEIIKYAGSPYKRVYISDTSEEFEVIGNYFNIDASKLPVNTIYSIGNVYGSSLMGYDIADTKHSIFLYMGLRNDYKASEQGNASTCSYSNMKLVGNTTTPEVNFGLDSDQIQSAIDLMSKNSGGHIGFRAAYKNTINCDNVIIAGTTIAIFSTNYSEFDLNKVYVYDSWANSAYSYGGSRLTFKGCVLGSSGGAAIHSEDIYSYMDNGQPVRVAGDITIDSNTRIENYVSGEEAWFKAYTMEIAAMKLKVEFDNGIRGLGSIFGQDLTVIKNVVNPITGQESEMINLVMLSVARGNNGDLNLGGTGTSHDWISFTNDTGFMSAGIKTYINSQILNNITEEAVVKGIAKESGFTDEMLEAYPYEEVRKQVVAGLDAQFGEGKGEAFIAEQLANLKAPFPVPVDAEKLSFLSLEIDPANYNGMDLTSMVGTNKLYTEIVPTTLDNSRGYFVQGAPIPGFGNSVVILEYY
ncbi:MAG: hypothetical protein J6R47_06700, partial [Acholeplasmatales bacterium]|nr:hypothetical protein [Acholeplasmatales bacterium]